MTIHLTPVQERRLESLAAYAGRTPDELVQAEMDRFLDEEEAMLLAVQRGNNDIAEGRVLKHEDVVSRIEKLTQNR